MDPVTAAIIADLAKMLIAGAFKLAEISKMELSELEAEFEKQLALLEKNDPANLPKGD